MKTVKEIHNPGYSLKSPDDWGEPSSMLRNPRISEIFHDTNLAETKGTGIGAMCRLMKEAGLMPPTFESNHEANKLNSDSSRRKGKVATLTTLEQKR